MFNPLKPVSIGQLEKFTYRIGRKNETEFDLFTTRTSSLGHLKSSFYCVRKLFTIVNSLHI